MTKNPTVRAAVFSLSLYIYISEILQYQEEPAKKTLFSCYLSPISDNEKRFTVYFNDCNPFFCSTFFFFHSRFN